MAEERSLIGEQFNSTGYGAASQSQHRQEEENYPVQNKREDRRHTVFDQNYNFGDAATRDEQEEGHVDMVHDLEKNTGNMHEAFIEGDFQYGNKEVVSDSKKELKIEPKHLDKSKLFENAPLPVLVDFGFETCQDCDTEMQSVLHSHISKLGDLDILISQISTCILEKGSLLVAVFSGETGKRLKAEINKDDLVDPDMIKAEYSEEEEDNEEEYLDYSNNTDYSNFLDYSSMVETNLNQPTKKEDGSTQGGVKKRGRPKLNLSDEERKEWLKLKQKQKRENKKEKEKDMTFPCEECGKNLTTSKGLRRHIEIHHRQNPKYTAAWRRTSNYVCPTCGLAMHDTYSKYFYHKELCEAQATGINKHVCSICGRSFPTSSHHANHYTSCSGNGKKYYNSKACTYEGCDFRTSSKLELSNHTRRIHLNLPIEKNHVCTVCGSAFNKVHILNNHMKAVHEGEKPHECSICGKAFARKQKMKEHMLIHTGDLSWTCPLCGKSMTNSGSKYNHKRSCTGIVKEREESNEKPFSNIESPSQMDSHSNAAPPLTFHSEYSPREVTPMDRSPLPPNTGFH